jgi:hypothetical protein
LALLWWRELGLGRKIEINISCNKAVFPVFWRLVDLVLLYGTRQSPVMLNVRLLRWKFGAICKSGKVFFSKQFGGLLGRRSSLLLLSLLVGRRGEEKVKLVSTLYSDGGCWGFVVLRLHASSSSVGRAWLATLDAGGSNS